MRIEDSCGQKKTGPDSQEVTERPGEFRLVHQWVQVEIQRGLYQNTRRKFSKFKDQCRVQARLTTSTDMHSKSQVLIFVK